MKKRSIKNLALNKKSITNLNSSNGGAIHKDPSFIGCHTGCDGDFDHSCTFVATQCDACNPIDQLGTLDLGHL